MKNSEIPKKPGLMPPVLNLIGAAVLLFFGISGLVYWLDKLTHQ